MRPLVDRWPRLAALYRSVRDGLDVMDESVVTPWGFTLAGNAAMASGSFEQTETALVRDILRDVDVLVNVGANIGYYCCHALSMGKQVIAFEPIQRNLRYLYRNIKDNGWSGCEVYPIALSNGVGVLEMYGGNTGASTIKGWAGTSGGYVTLVPTTTMDAVVGTRLRGKRALILVDVEGAERAMLEGAAAVLANDPRPTWLIEIMTRDHQPRGVELNPHVAVTFELLLGNGYRAFSIDQRARPITTAHVDLMSRGKLDFESHNFLFQE